MMNINVHRSQELFTCRFFTFWFSAILLFLFSHTLAAQTTFCRRIGGTAIEEGRSIILSHHAGNPDGYVIAGYSASSGSGQVDAYVVKTDLAGNVLWARTVGSSAPDEAYDVIQLPDDGYVVTGFTYTGGIGSGNEDILVFKLDYSGNLVWSAVFGDTASREEGLSVFPVPSGNLMVCGHIDHHFPLFLELDNNGNLVSSWSYAGTFLPFAGVSATALDNGDVLMAGIIYSGYLPGFLLMKTRPDLSSENVSFGGNMPDYGLAITTTRNGSVVAAGVTYSLGAGSSDVYLIKTDTSLHRKWDLVVGGTNIDEAYSVIETADGGYVVVGMTVSGDSSAANALLAKADASGNLLWTRAINLGSDEVAHSVVEAPDGGLVITGSATDSGNQQILLVKTDNQGNVCQPCLAASVLNSVSGADSSTATVYGSQYSVGANTVTVILQNDFPAKTTLCSTTGSEIIPDDAAGLSAFPNPFGTALLFTASVPQHSASTLTLYNLPGMKIREFELPAGASNYRQVFWDGCDEAGRPVPPGLYLAVLRTGSRQYTLAVVRTAQ